MIYRNFEQLIETVRAKSKKKRTVAVVAAQDGHTLEAVVKAAAKDEVIEPLLVGDKEAIEKLLTAMGERPANYEVIHAATAEDAAVGALKLVNGGRADFLMKGLIPTAGLMKVLFSDNQFRVGSLLSHLSIIHIPNYHKLVGLTDVALNICPDLNQKRAIVENAVTTMARMGFDPPKVAILAASDEVSAKMPETTDAAELKKLNAAGELPGCLVEGPLSYDLAFSKEAAAIKGHKSPVCGEVDLLVVPNISAGNILIKALRYAAGASSAGIVVGGRVPIVLTSRAAETEAKLLPLILAASATL
ncbi:phosphate acyltransferase [Anaeroselena agilis]|uniref:Phosphate acyltransferase n=1 Tax=Anaeroselena agilis TaxID=3063788 RepID=A0ABU3P337_9FIRM|nr:phosphate acyltransferase [Selenomonadales bacterium 4137-cl]